LFQVSENSLDAQKYKNGGEEDRRIGGFFEFILNIF
jgi:hypothetical protein